AFSPYLKGWCPWNYASPGQTAERLRAAGFRDVRTWLVQRPKPYEDLRSWLSNNALSAHQLRLPQDLREGYVDAVERALGPEPTTTYVRLEIDAVAA
ncbi:MAG TPA: methyltransferase type 11, partial [Solirubrobacteraceae bacterium]|nr:methyltransferase type 11 [Solirubrobacteraceae bacterium]